MDDLFEKLKSEPPINKVMNSLSAPSNCFVLQVDANEEKVPDKVSNDKGDFSNRRDSLPVINVSTIPLADISRSRSVSPPKKSLLYDIKPLRVRIERKRLEGMQITLTKDRYFSESLKRKCISTFKNESTPEKVQKISLLKKDIMDENDTMLKEGELQMAPKRIEMKTTKTQTPTKAQQKLFDAIVVTKSKEIKLKRCIVRIHRDNLEEMLKVFNNNQKGTKNKKKLDIVDSLNMSSQRVVRSKNKSQITSDKSLSKRSTTKKGKVHIVLKKLPIKKTNDKKIRKKSQSKNPTSSRVTREKNELINKTNLKPIKFTRSQLVKKFGKRFFLSYVHMERCKHSIVEASFDLTEREQKEKEKHNKNKNLSVSFNNQVEVLGSTDSESESCDIEPEVKASTSQEAALLLEASRSSTGVPNKLAELNNIGNNKEISNPGIELDSNLFLDLESINNSSPQISNIRKKREKKSYSPLKNDATPSPRKEHLKLANEKLPPSGLKSIDMDDLDELDGSDDYNVVPKNVSQAHVSPSKLEVVTHREPIEPMSVKEEFTTSQNIESVLELSIDDRDTSDSFASALEIGELSDIAPILDVNVTIEKNIKDEVNEESLKITDLELTTPIKDLEMKVNTEEEVSSSMDVANIGNTNGNSSKNEKDDNNGEMSDKLTPLGDLFVEGDSDSILLNDSINQPSLVETINKIVNETLTKDIELDETII